MAVRFAISPNYHSSGVQLIGSLPTDRNLTVAAWVNVGAWSASYNFPSVLSIYKTSGGNVNYLNLGFDDGFGAVKNYSFLRRYSGTVEATVRAADNSVDTTDKWQFICGVDNGAGSPLQMYVGDEATVAAEPSTYPLQDTPSGTPEYSSLAEPWIGNRIRLDNGFPGAIAFVGVYDGALTAEQIREIQVDPARAMSKQARALLFPGLTNIGDIVDTGPQGFHGRTTLGSAAVTFEAPTKFIEPGRVLHRPLMLELAPKAATISQATGSAAGVGAASGSGAAQTTATGSAAGVGVASADGASITAASGVAAGVGVANGAGAAVTAADGTASGIGSASAVGGSLAACVGSATGVGTATAAGSAVAVADGSASGIGAASAATSSFAAGDGAASGVGTASGVSGATSASGAGAATGTGTATGSGASVSAAPGTAGGLGTATGIGAATATANGASAGLGTATGAGMGLVVATGAATGTGSSAGAGAATAASAGTAAGVGAASAVTKVLAATVGTASGFGLATGVGASLGTSTRRVASPANSRNGGTITTGSTGGTITTPKNGGSIRAA